MIFLYLYLYLYYYYYYYYYLETYHCGDFIYYIDNDRQKKLGRLRAILLNEENQHQFKIQKVLYYNDLPNIFKSNIRQQNSFNGEVWLQDELFQIIKMSQLVKKATIMIAYQHQHIPKSLYINEIIYLYNGHWQIRSVILLYQHPSEYITIRNPPSSMPIYKIFLDLYYDDFGTFRNVYHSLGGVYIQFGNMPAHQRKLLKNHFVLGFVPFGGDFNEFLHPFISEMKKFEQGKIMKVNGQNSWIIASLGVVTSNLP